MANAFLERVSLDLRNDNGATGPFTVELYRGGFLVPETLVAELAGPVNPGNGVAVYTPTSAIVLRADMVYWVSARASAATEKWYSWLIANGAPAIGTSPAGKAAFNVGSGHWENSQSPSELLALRVEATQPRISLPVAGSNIQFTVSELMPGQITLIQVSSNLANWTDISTNVPAASSFVFTNATALAKTNNQFYRVVQLP